MGKWRNGKLYKTWKKIAIKRQKKCQICDKPFKLEVHHIKDGSSYPALRYLQSNAIVMCKKCHFNFHVYYMQGYQNTCDDKDLKYFKKLMKVGKFNDRTI